MNIRPLIAKCMLAGTLILVPLAPAVAAPYWPFGDHSRVNEVNDRLDRTEFRISHDMELRIVNRFDGERLQEEHRAIRREETRMRNAHAGYITEDEQFRLNQRIDDLDRNIAMSERH